ncbi:MAG: response regulator [Bacteroidales bacterium]|jgi:CheY-like chemotaxis protein|nr:response regulator [Bacteroidales bacterium]
MSNEKKLILIADDDADYLFQMEAMVKNLGYRVKTAESQAEAEKVLETTKPDLAIFDLMMENEDSGFILCYKAKRRYPDLPIIMASAATAETGYSFDLHGESGKGWIKADLYLEKGIRSDQLHREINKLLKL